MEIHIWDPNGLYIWNPALYRFSGIHRVRAWRRTLRHVQLPRGWRSSTGSTVGLSGAVFSKPTRNRGPSVLLPVWGENTGGNRFHTKAIESSECVSGRPARSSTNICQWGAMSWRPGGRYTSRRVSSQPERARHTENACRSLTLLMEASASRSRVFIERNLGLTVYKGSNGPCCNALSTKDRSQEGIEGGRGGFSLLAPLRNPTTQSCFPTDFPSTGSWLAAIAAT